MRDAEWGGIRITAVPMEEKENRREDKGRRDNEQRGRGDGTRSRVREREIARATAWATGKRSTPSNCIDRRSFLYRGDEYFDLSVGFHELRGA